MKSFINIKAKSNVAIKVSIYFGVPYLSYLIFRVFFNFPFAKIARFPLNVETFKIKLQNGKKQYTKTWSFFFQKNLEG